MKRTFHVCLNIEGFLLNATPRDFKRMFVHDGRPVDWRTAKRFLLEQLALGRKVLPYGPICPGFSYETGCPGHEVTEGEP